MLRPYKTEHSGYITNDKTFIFEINLAESQVYTSPMQRVG